MKQYQINQAYEILMKFSNAQLTPKKAYQLYSLMKQIETEYNFLIEQEKKLVEKFSGEINSITGELSFKAEEDKNNFIQEYQEFQNLDSEITITPIELSFSDIENLTISPSELFFLENFIKFIE